MINQLFLLSGIGMMLAGILPVLWWRYRTLVSWRYFIWGGGVWALAAALKAALDLAVTPMLVGWLAGTYTVIGIAMISGAYIGLRTGVLESGLTYLAVIRKSLSRMNFRQAMAFGIAFGSTEAFVLGLLSFLNVAVVLAFPHVVDLMTTAQRAAVLQLLSFPDVMVIIPVIERSFTILIHIFCAVLVIQSVKTGHARYFVFSFIYKVVLDGTLPFLTLIFDRGSIAGTYYPESFVVVPGLISLVSMFSLRAMIGMLAR